MSPVGLWAAIAADIVAFEAPLFCGPFAFGAAVIVGFFAGAAAGFFAGVAARALLSSTVIVVKHVSTARATAFVVVFRCMGLFS